MTARCRVVTIALTPSHSLPGSLRPQGDWARTMVVSTIVAGGRHGIPYHLLDRAGRRRLRPRPLPPVHQGLPARNRGSSVPTGPADCGGDKALLPINRTAMRLYRSPGGRCAICNTTLLAASDRPQTPRDWEHWLATTRKTIDVVWNTATTDAAAPQLVHLNCSTATASHQDFLEPDARRPARPVLRGARGRNAPGLPECAQHDQQLGGASPLWRLMAPTTSQWQLRRREAGWEGSRRRNRDPRNTWRARSRLGPGGLRV